MPSRVASRAGFSLVEMIVIMAIIGIIAAVGVGSFRLSGQNTAVSTAAATVGSAVSAARQLAITKNCRTRFFIVTDGQDEWKLHRYGILRVPEDTVDIDSTGTEEFELAGRVDELPVGVYFRENTHNSTDNAAGGSSMFSSSQGSTTLSGKGVQYAYIEFLPSGGTKETSGSNIFEISRAPTAEQKMVDDKNYIRMGVVQATGRVKFERPGLL